MDKALIANARKHTHTHTHMQTHTKAHILYMVETLYIPMQLIAAVACGALSVLVLNVKTSKKSNLKFRPRVKVWSPLIPRTVGLGPYWPTFEYCGLIPAGPTGPKISGNHTYLLPYSPVVFVFYNSQISSLSLFICL